MDSVLTATPPVEAGETGNNHQPHNSNPDCAHPPQGRDDTLRPLHILLVTSARSRGLGGSDRDWVNLANALDPARFQVTWIGGSGTAAFLRTLLDPAVSSQLFEIEAPLLTEIIQDNAARRRSLWLWTKIMGDHLLHLAQPLRQLHKVVEQTPVDLVVSQTSDTMLGVLWATLARRPHIWFVKECLDRRIAACRVAARVIKSMSAEVVVPSRAVARSFPGQVTVMPDGNEVATIRRPPRLTRAQVLQELNLPLDHPVVAQVGSVVMWKGQHVTAAAWVQLAARQSGVPSCSLLFLGDPNPVYRRRLELILAAAPESWQEAVRFVRFQPDDFSYLAAADVVVHPSVFPDPFPNAIREAMLLGKPVIGANGGGIPEMLVHNETGLLVPPRNVDALADMMARLVVDSDLRALLGAAAEAYALDHFDILRRKADFETLFHRIAGGG